MEQLAVRLETFFGKTGKNAGKELVSIVFDGTGFRGLSPYVVRLVLANSAALAPFAQMTDEQLFARAHAEQARVAALKLAMNASTLPVAQTTNDNDNAIKSQIHAKADAIRMHADIVAWLVNVEKIDANIAQELANDADTIAEYRKYASANVPAQKQTLAQIRAERDGNATVKAVAAAPVASAKSVIAQRIDAIVDAKVPFNVAYKFNGVRVTETIPNVSHVSDSFVGKELTNAQGTKKVLNLLTSKEITARNGSASQRGRAILLKGISEGYVELV